MSLRTFLERLGVASPESEAPEAEVESENERQPSCRERGNVYVDGRCIDNPASRPPPPNRSWIIG